MPSRTDGTVMAMNIRDQSRICTIILMELKLSGSFKSEAPKSFGSDPIMSETESSEQDHLQLSPFESS